MVARLVLADLVLALLITPWVAAAIVGVLGSSGNWDENLLAIQQRILTRANLLALADRFAEALAERLHQIVRTQLWGYAPDEALDNEALIREQYRGIRPAPGYPACPEHSEKATIFRLLEAETNAGMSLTESFAMLPTAAVSGLYFSHPGSQYFVVGRVSREQVADYARRKGVPLHQAERWLAANLDYDPE